MDTRDLSIIGQNAGTTAAALAGPIRPDEDLNEYLDTFETIRLRVFNGSLALAGTNVQAVQEGIEAAAAAEAERILTKGSQPTAPAAASTPSSGRLNVIKPTGPIPDWLESQVEWLIGKGDIPDVSPVDLWDNRGYGKGAPFKTKWKAPDAQYGVSVWPPKGQS